MQFISGRERYGLVDRQRDKTRVRPVVKATGLRIMAAARDRSRAMAGRHGAQLPIEGVAIQE
jgi:hypothetical protein